MWLSKWGVIELKLWGEKIKLKVLHVPILKKKVNDVCILFMLILLHVVFCEEIFHLFFKINASKNKYYF